MILENFLTLPASVCSFSSGGLIVLNFRPLKMSFTGTAVKGVKISMAANRGKRINCQTVLLVICFSNRLVWHDSQYVEYLYTLRSFQLSDLSCWSANTLLESFALTPIHWSAHQEFCKPKRMEKTLRRKMMYWIQIARNKRC